MRLGSFFCLLTVLSGICAAQETNFPVGPQYLMTNGTPMFARPLATPSLSLGEALPTSAAAESETSNGVQVSTGSTISNQANLFPIYYGRPEPAELSAELSVVEAAEGQPTVIEISSTAPLRNLPASILDTGVTGLTNAQSLRERGYGISLGDAASYWKTHKPHVPRVFTNRDVERLHGS